jgi:hypothetical protein
MLTQRSEPANTITALQFLSFSLTREQGCFVVEVIMNNPVPINDNPSDLI